MLVLDFPQPNIIQGLPLPFHDRIKKLLNKPQQGTTGTDSSVSSFGGTHDATDALVEIQVREEKELISLWNDLSNDSLSFAKKIHFSFTAFPTQKMGEMRQLRQVFVALGKLPHLEELVVSSSVLFVNSFNKLFKKAMLRKLIFHHCTFIVANTRSMENLWSGIRRQQRLQVLEIVDCTCIPYQKIPHNQLSMVSKKKASTAYSFQIPSFLREQRLPKLRRLVLDGCILEDGPDDHRTFVKLLSHNRSLEELELRPVFEVRSVGRCHQYQARKRAVHNFMTQTIPETLSTNKSRLKKLVVSLEDYLLETVYEDAMICWIELVQHNNTALTDMRLTHQPLLLSSERTSNGDDGFGLYPNSWLECSLQYHLRLNRLQSRRQNNELDESIREEVLAAEAPGISCLRSLLQSNPDIWKARTHSVSYQPKKDSPRTQWRSLRT